MLDFYLIKDDEPKPNYPEQIGLQFAGSLDEETFSNLKFKKVVTDKFDYYSDFRWGTAIIIQIRQRVTEKRMQEDFDVKKLLVLLYIAKQHEAGLIAYAD